MAMNKLYLFSVISLLLVAGVVSFGGYADFSNNPDVSGSQSVELYRITPGTIKEEVRARVTVEPAHKQEVWLNEGSDLDKLNVSTGDNVERGDVIAVFKNRELNTRKHDALMDMIAMRDKLDRLKMADYNEDVVKAKRELQLVQIEYEKQKTDLNVLKELYNSKAIALNELKDAEARLKKTELRMEAERDNLMSVKEKLKIDKDIAEIEYEKVKEIYTATLEEESALTVKAEFSGTVVSVSDDTEESDSPIVTIATTYRLIGQLEIDTYDIDKVKEGNSLRVEFGENLSPLLGAIQSIGHEVVQEKSGMGGQNSSVVKASAPLFGDSLGKIKLGRTAEAIITTQQHFDSLVVPFESVLEDEGGYYLFVSQNGRLKKQYIQTGISTRDAIEIVDGIEPDSLVVGAGNLWLKEGDVISVSSIVDYAAVDAVVGLGMNAPGSGDINDNLEVIKIDDISSLNLIEADAGLMQ